MTVLLAEHIEKAFGDQRILRDCGLSVQAGERLGLVGVNGSGKSTFLSILAGTLRTDGGRVQHLELYTA